MNYIIEEQRAYLINDQGTVVAYVTFPRINDYEACINQTYVDHSMRGKGVANQLMEYAYEQIKKQNLKAFPECSYAINWFESHPEKRDILAR